MGATWLFLWTTLGIFFLPGNKCLMSDSSLTTLTYKDLLMNPKVELELLNETDDVVLILFKEGILKSFELWKRSMTTGFPNHNIAKLDAFQVKFPLVVKVFYPALRQSSLSLVLKNVTITGLSKFKVKDLSIDKSKRLVQFTNAVDKLHLNAEYSLNTGLSSNFKFPISQGKLSAILHNTEVQGKFVALPEPIKLTKVARVRMHLLMKDFDVKVEPQGLKDDISSQLVMLQFRKVLNALRNDVNNALELSYTKTIELWRP